MSKTVHCNRCRRRYRNQDNWNLVWIAGYSAGSLCPDCQTLDEDLEAELNAITGASENWSVLDPHDDFEGYLNMLIDNYPTPEIMRSKAGELAAARPDLLKGPVDLMRRLGDEMESGKIFEPN